MLKKGCLLVCLLCQILFADEFAFEGTHLLASYIGCDEKALSDSSILMEVFVEAVETSGATLLSKQSREFNGGGFTMIILLSESHASIHTYPEHNSCFVDLFTCGTNCSYESFDYILSEYLQPEKIEKKVISRGQKIHDFSKSHKGG